MTFEIQLKEYWNSHKENFTNQLTQLISIPSISQLTQHTDDCRKVLDIATEILQNLGFTASIVETKGLPSLVAKLESSPSAPWITIYNHLDVQPAEEPQWNTDPFEPVVNKEKIKGRGATDDKGPALTILHAISFLKKHAYPLPNIQIVYETEEEKGSTNFSEVLSRLRKTDSILISDTIFEGEHPTITYALRGLVRANVSLTTGTKDVHSGLVGGIAINPQTRLVQALATCMDNDGKITIPGFYDDVQPISDAEQENISKISNVFDRTQFQKDTGNARLYSYTPMDIIQKTWTQPSFEIHGFVGAQDNPHDFKTAIPYEVRAKVSMRIVLNQDSVDILQKLRKHLQTFDKNIQVTGDGTRAAVSDRTQSIFTKAAEACAKGFGQKPLFVASGGTIGAVPKMQAQFPGVPIVMIAQSLMSDGYHAPNEEFRLDQACKGMKTMVYYLRSLVPQ